MQERTNYRPSEAEAKLAGAERELAVCNANHAACSKLLREQMGVAERIGNENSDLIDQRDALERAVMNEREIEKLRVELGKIQLVLESQDLRLKEFKDAKDLAERHVAEERKAREIIGLERDALKTLVEEAVPWIETRKVEQQTYLGSIQFEEPSILVSGAKDFLREIEAWLAKAKEVLK